MKIEQMIITKISTSLFALAIILPGVIVMLDSILFSATNSERIHSLPMITMIHGNTSNMLIATKCDYPVFNTGSSFLSMTRVDKEQDASKMVLSLGTPVSTSLNELLSPENQLRYARTLTMAANSGLPPERQININDVTVDIAHEIHSQREKEGYLPKLKKTLEDCVYGFAQYIRIQDMTVDTAHEIFSWSVNDILSYPSRLANACLESNVFMLLLIGSVVYAFFVVTGGSFLLWMAWLYAKYKIMCSIVYGIFQNMLTFLETMGIYSHQILWGVVPVVTIGYTCYIYIMCCWYAEYLEYYAPFMGTVDYYTPLLAPFCHMISIWTIPGVIRVVVWEKNKYCIPQYYLLAAEFAFRADTGRTVQYHVLVMLVYFHYVLIRVVTDFVKGEFTVKFNIAAIRQRRVEYVNVSDDVCALFGLKAPKESSVLTIESKKIPWGRKPVLTIEPKFPEDIRFHSDISLLDMDDEE